MVLLFFGLRQRKDVTTREAVLASNEFQEATKDVQELIRNRCVILCQEDLVKVLGDTWRGVLDWMEEVKNK